MASQTTKATLLALLALFGIVALATHAASGTWFATGSNDNATRVSSEAGSDSQTTGSAKDRGGDGEENGDLRWETPITIHLVPFDNDPSRINIIGQCRESGPIFRPIRWRGISRQSREGFEDTADPEMFQTLERRLLNFFVEHLFHSTVQIEAVPDVPFEYVARAFDATQQARREYVGEEFAMPVDVLEHVVASMRRENRDYEPWQEKRDARVEWMRENGIWVDIVLSPEPEAPDEIIPDGEIDEPEED